MTRHHRPLARLVVLTLVLGGSVLGLASTTPALADEGPRSAGTAAASVDGRAGSGAAGEAAACTLQLDPAPTVDLGGEVVSAYSASHLGLLGRQTPELEEQGICVVGALPLGLAPHRP